MARKSWGRKEQLSVIEIATEHTQIGGTILERPILSMFLIEWNDWYRNIVCCIYSNQYEYGNDEKSNRRDFDHIKMVYISPIVLQIIN